MTSSDSVLQVSYDFDSKYVTLEDLINNTMDVIELDDMRVFTIKHFPELEVPVLRALCSGKILRMDLHEGRVATIPAVPISASEVISQFLSPENIEVELSLDIEQARDYQDEAMMIYRRG